MWFAGQRVRSGCGSCRWRCSIPSANVAYNLGITVSLTAVVSVISSLFSAVTVLMAWVFLRERLARWQWAGVGAILVGIVLVSA